MSEVDWHDQSLLTKQAVVTIQTIFLTYKQSETDA